MKVIIVHTQYRYKGGEDAVVAIEQSIVPGARSWIKYNHKGGAAFFQFLLSPYNPFVGYQFKRLLKREKPDVVHIHNLNFAIGPVVIRVAKELGVPVVMTLHNYRLLCPSATLLHNNQVFTDSINASFPWKAVKKKVYRNSYFQTFWLAFSNWCNTKTGTWKMVDRYIVLTDFARQTFTKTHLHLPEQKFVIKPNFVAAGEVQPSERTNQFLFVGRLSNEKGITILLEAAVRAGCMLKIAGDGPCRSEVEKFAGRYPQISYLGALSTDEVQKEMQQCSALILPSICFEGMPMTIIEAFASGLPVIASDIGAMASMISNCKNGLLFPPADINALTNTLSKWQQLPQKTKKQMGTAARQTYENLYTPEKNYEQLKAIYTSVINENKKATSLSH